MEGNVLFNDALNTNLMMHSFYLWLYGIEYYDS